MSYTSLALYGDSSVSVWPTSHRKFSNRKSVIIYNHFMFIILQLAVPEESLGGFGMTLPGRGVSDAQVRNQFQ